MRILRCASCGLYFVHPQPDLTAVQALYSANPTYAITRHVRLDETSPEHARDIDASILAVQNQRGTLLDVGCSTGTTIYHLRTLGWSVTGVDLNRESLAIAKNHGLDVRLGTIEELPDDHKYDVIRFGDVIEHMPSPRSTLEKARRLLTPDGLVVIDAPNARSNLAGITLLLSRATHAPWVHSEAPYHLWEFSEKSMNALLTRTGYVPVRVQ
jgi:2-polyprenyl-3-methyl-5-hydroxy-6-metoxy-1,4-benzoquinol methylase